MKATDLMVWDWIRFKERNYQVCAVSNNGVVYLQYLGTENFEPIPLTPEILEKNGFEPKGSLREKESGSIIKFFEKADRIGSDNRLLHALTASISGNRCSIGIFTDYGLNVRYNSRLTKTIYYVHELQHALRLCGFTDLADNFII